jgi:hypothetical protein
MAATETSTAPARGLQDVLTLAKPLGPPDTESLLHGPSGVFQLLYDRANHIHHEAYVDDPPFIVGRKGAGKTAFLAGAALLAEADVILIESKDIYSAIERLRRDYEDKVGRLYTDTLAYAWEVLLTHAAMFKVCRSERIPRDEAWHKIWFYVGSFGDPKELKKDELLARVSNRISQSFTAEGEPFRNAVKQLDLGHGTFESARQALRSILERAGGRRKLYVVIDNLEDLHKRIDELSDTISALVRVPARSTSIAEEDRLPFSVRFAFPAELLERLYKLSVNPHKDFASYLTIRWKASELIVLAGNRLRWFLDARFPASIQALGLPKTHNPNDAEAAARTLRALLPEGSMRNGVGAEEDPVAYVMRHTQLLPRDLILSLNFILAETLKRQGTTAVPRASGLDVVRGIHSAERVIVQGVLSTYQPRYPKIAEALSRLTNRLEFVVPTNVLHRHFNQAGIKRALDMEWDEFLEAALAIGAFGITTSATERYERAEFAYTFTDDLRPVEGKDNLCVHPLFMYRLFDGRTIKERAAAGALPVYPYGSDLEDEEHETR